MAGNMFSGFIQAGQNRSNAIGQGIEALAQGYQNKQTAEVNAQKQQQAMQLLDQASQLSDTDPQASQQAFMQAVQIAPEFVSQVTGMMKQRREAQGNVSSLSQQEFEQLTAGMTPEEKEQARRIKLGLAPRAVGSSAMTISDTGKAEDVAESESIIAGAKAQAAEEGKSRGISTTSNIVGKAKADIARAVKAAEVQGKSKGESVTQLDSAKAALPSLIGVVDSLKTLAPVATNTYSGKAFDFLAKEAGFGATKGAEARAKFIAIIDNQVLPLLKQTFGAAFTATEGEALKKTMGDPDASAEAKIAQLNSFIENKVREIEVKERELGAESQPQEQQSETIISWDSM